MPAKLLLGRLISYTTKLVPSKPKVTPNQVFSVPLAVKLPPDFQPVLLIQLSPFNKL